MSGQNVKSRPVATVLFSRPRPLRASISPLRRSLVCRSSLFLAHGARAEQHRREDQRAAVTAFARAAAVHLLAHQQSSQPQPLSPAFSCAFSIRQSGGECATPIRAAIPPPQSTHSTFSIPFSFVLRVGHHFLCAKQPPLKCTAERWWAPNRTLNLGSENPKKEVHHGMSASSSGGGAFTRVGDDGGPGGREGNGGRTAMGLLEVGESEKFDAMNFTIATASPSARYFENPFKDSDPIEELVTNEWVSTQVSGVVRRIQSIHIPEEASLKGPYAGICGIAYALMRANKLHGSDYADWVHSLLDRGEPTASRKHNYLTGTIGYLVVKVSCYHQLGIPFDRVLAHIRSELGVMQSSDGRVEDEMMNGRAGYLAGLLALRQEIGTDLLTESELGHVLDAIINSGRNNAKIAKRAGLLVYEWHEKNYFGAAHGLSGILQMLLSYWTLLKNDQRDDVKRTLDWLLSIQSDDGNFPSSSGWVGRSKSEDYELVHWCHGATGAIHVLICAFLTLKEEKYLEAAKRCAELVWRKGLLKKGPGICHGVAGGGYAFLLLYRLTSDTAFLRRAKAFAIVMMDAGFAKMSRVPDAPWSLYEGWSGALCFLLDLIEPTRAQFPLVPIPFEK